MRPDIARDLALDSIARDNVRFRVAGVRGVQRMLLFRPVQWFKVTVKPSANLTLKTLLAYERRINGSAREGVDIMIESTFSGMDFGDLMGLAVD